MNDMSIEFVKNGNKVMITKDGNLIGGVSVDCSVLADPEKDDFVLITSRIDSTDNQEAIRIDWNKVTTPVVADRNDLITKLSTDFFFRVSGSLGDGTTIPLGDYRIIATENGLNIDKKLTELGFDGVQSADGGLTGDWVNLGGF